MNSNAVAALTREPWNKGKLVGQKAPLKLRDIWAIRVRLQLSNDIRNLALFNLAIDSKLRACDLHALGTPPAFVLSQDQTLHNSSLKAHLLC